jgi:methionyl aminopeptidase
MCIETAQDMHGLLHIGQIVALTLQEMEAHLRPGMTTKQLDLIGAKVLRQHHARSAPILTYKFPGTTALVSMRKRPTAFRAGASFSPVM